MCMFPTNSECLIGISDAFSAFCLRVSVILPTCSLYPQQKRAYSYSALHPQAWTYIYIQLHARRHLPIAVPWISEDRLLNDTTKSELRSFYLRNVQKPNISLCFLYGDVRQPIVTTNMAGENKTKNKLKQEPNTLNDDQGDLSYSVGPPGTLC